MELDARTRWYLRLQNLLFVVLTVALLGLVAWLGERYDLEFDWTANQRNSLTDESAVLLERLDAPIRIVAFASENEALRDAIGQLVDRYRRVKPDVSLEFVNPDLAPEQARSEGVRFDGTLVVHYQGRREQLSAVNEAALSQALARLSRERGSWVVFMRGHGERAHDGVANFDYATLSKELVSQGFLVQSLNLAAQTLPDNTGILVIAGPRTDWVPVEIERVREYVANGGNVIWLTDPQGVMNPPQLTEIFDIEVKPGTVVDATTQLLGVADPTVAVVTDYPDFGPVANFNLMTLFPRAAALASRGADNWSVVPILRTLENSWRETGALAGNVKPGEGEELGPLTIGLALERHEGTQRVLVLGDGDFASNAYLGNQGNLDLALNLFNWLATEDELLDIRIKDAPDANLNLSSEAQLVIALGFLIVLPLALALAGLLVFLRRRRR